MSGTIHLRGVRVHNLKGVDVELPLGRLTVISGVSGAGKTSLALDTLYAEAQRRYWQSFSAATRQLLERLDEVHSSGQPVYARDWRVQLDADADGAVDVRACRLALDDRDLGAEAALGLGVGGAYERRREVRVLLRAWSLAPGGALQEREDCVPA